MLKRIAAFLIMLMLLPLPALGAAPPTPRPIVPLTEDLIPQLPAAVDETCLYLIVALGKAIEGAIRCRRIRNRNRTAEALPGRGEIKMKDIGIAEIHIPEALKGSEGCITSTVDYNYFIWIITNAQVWRGRLNRLGFAQQ